MANRSHIYNSSFDPNDHEKGEGDKVFGLSEYPYTIPLSHLLLCSAQPRLCPSLIFEDERGRPLAIVGDFAGGKAALFHFLERLDREDVFDAAVRASLIQGTRDFLSKPHLGLKHALLEATEIYGLEATDSRTEAHLNEETLGTLLRMPQHVNEVLTSLRQMQPQWLDLKIRLEALSREKMATPETDKARQAFQHHHHDMMSLLGLEYWSTVLYFHFDTAPGEED